MAKSQVFNNGECIECPYNCALCKSRDKKSLAPVNPQFDPKKLILLNSAIFVQKSYTVPSVPLNCDYELDNFVECSTSTTCKQKALIDMKFQCNKKVSTVVKGYDQGLINFKLQNYIIYFILKEINQQKLFK